MTDPTFIVLLVVLAVVVLLVSGWLRRDSGLPDGKVIYSDTARRLAVDKPLYSRRFNLVGKPDYLVQQGKAIIPVEVKSGAAPPQGPYAAHIYQLAAYCQLVHDTYQVRPGHGLIQYRDRQYKVDYTPQLERELHNVLAAMRRDASQSDVARSHNAAARCRACGVRDACEVRLV